MLHALARHWWVLLLRGLCAIAFGILAMTWPGLTLWALVFLFGAYALGDGLTAIIASFAGKDEAGRSWWQLLLVGVISIVAGVAAIVWPGVTAMALLYMIAAWAIVRGLFEIIAAIRLRKLIENELLLGLAGAASVAFGVMLIASPGSGALAVLWVIGIFAILHGVLLASLAFRIRKFKQRLDAARQHVMGT